jgi:hypothetical protein
MKYKFTASNKSTALGSEISDVFSVKLHSDMTIDCLFDLRDKKKAKEMAAELNAVLKKYKKDLY